MSRPTLAVPYTVPYTIFDRRRYVGAIVRPHSRYICYLIYLVIDLSISQMRSYVAKYPYTLQNCMGGGTKVRPPLTIKPTGSIVQDIGLGTYRPACLPRLANRWK